MKQRLADDVGGAEAGELQVGVIRPREDVILALENSKKGGSLSEDRLQVVKQHPSESWADCFYSKSLAPRKKPGVYPGAIPTRGRSNRSCAGARFCRP